MPGLSTQAITLLPDVGEYIWKGSGGAMTLVFVLSNSCFVRR
jgi:hypothetical protein